jgi:hypothetical protein
MKTSPLSILLGLGLLCGCSTSGVTQGGPAALPIGAPAPAFDASVLGTAQQPSSPALRLPDRITIPASYRMMLLDGHFALVREADSQALDPSPTSMRIVTGEISRGEIAYQPALLPQELATEVAANRESAGRMDNALESVMARSRELSEQARSAQAQSQRLGELLAAAEARIRELESARKPRSTTREADKADPGDHE